MPWTRGSRTTLIPASCAKERRTSVSGASRRLRLIGKPRQGPVGALAHLPLNDAAPAEVDGARALVDRRAEARHQQAGEEREQRQANHHEQPST